MPFAALLKIESMYECNFSLLLMFVDLGAFEYKVITFDLDELNFISH